jgi:hypothetical protein
MTCKKCKDNHKSNKYIWCSCKCHEIIDRSSIDNREKSGLETGQGETK